MNKENILSSEGNLHNNTQSFPPNKFTRWKADLLLYKKVVVSLNSPPYFHWIFRFFFIWLIFSLADFKSSKSCIGSGYWFRITFYSLFFEKSKNGRGSIRSNDLNTRQITKRWSLNRCLLLNRFIDHYYRVRTPFITTLGKTLTIFLQLYYTKYWVNEHMEVF